MYNVSIEHLIKNIDLIELSVLVKLYEHERKRESIRKDINIIYLPDYEFNYCFNNNSFKNMLFYINNIDETHRDKKEWLLKLIYFLDNVK